MSPLTQADSPLRARLPLLLAALAVLVTAIAGGLVATAGAERAIVLGKTKKSPKPNCPTPRDLRNDPDPPQSRTDEFCQVIGQMTGFQKSTDDKRGLFRAPGAGHIVAWSVDLSKPRKSERDVFGEGGRTDRFGEQPTAGISILQRKQQKKFELKRKSPVLDMHNYYGEQPIITLDKPLPVRKDQIVALTTLTWLPNLAAKDLSRQNTWVASRKTADCNVPQDIPAEDRVDYFFAHTSPHKRVGSERRYECEYERARLMYWAYFVPKS